MGNLKDKITTWYIREIYSPQRELINNPGFICEKMGESNIYLREIAFSASIGIYIERRLRKNKKILYKIGKEFGLLYGRNSNLVSVEESSEDKFMKMAHLLIRYMEAISFAKKMKEKIDYKNRIFKLRMKDTMICSKSGLGYLFENGGITGIWSYVCKDKTIEGVQTKCQGRGDDECEIVAAPYEKMKEMGYKPIKCTDMEMYQLDEEYEKFNQVRPVKWANQSLRNLIDSMLIKYSHGKITYKNERFFLCEASFIYLLEKELKKLKGGLKVLWDVSFEFGKKLAEISKHDDPVKIIMDLFPALGFGDILVNKNSETKYDIFVNYFPWTKWAPEVDFTMFRGMLSGVISGSVGKKVELKKVEKDLSMGYLSLHITN